MFKKSIIALATVAALAGAAAPAFADTGALFGSGNTDDFARQSVVTRLEQKGLNVTSVEEWNGYVRAFVTNADGTHGQQFFEADTLAPVNLGANS